MPKASFGPFADAFEKHGLTVPGYLELLHCRGSGVDLVLDRVQTALSAEKPQM